MPEHLFTQRLTLQCPQRRHVLGHLAADTNRLSLRAPYRASAQRDTDGEPIYQPSSWTTADGIAWLCPACYHTEPRHPADKYRLTPESELRRASGPVPPVFQAVVPWAVLLELLATQYAYGPAHIHAAAARKPLRREIDRRTPSGDPRATVRADRLAALQRFATQYRPQQPPSPEQSLRSELARLEAEARAATDPEERAALLLIAEIYRNTLARAGGNG